MRTLKIYGCPGGGKTFTLLKYFEEELKTVKPERIGFLTFTRTARLEALSRASLTEEELPFVKTIHATCYKALNMDQTQLVSKQDLIEFGRSIGVYLTGAMPDLFSLEPTVTEWKQPSKADRLLQLNHLGRHRGLRFKEAMKDAPHELDYKYALWFTKAYRAWKTATAKRDYTDLLTDYLETGDVPDLDVMFVDEAQDLSLLQWQVARKLWANCQRVYICGDPDQTIFRWAGASAQLFDCEPADEISILPHSYRLSNAIHAVSQKIIHRVKVRLDKEFTCRDSPGEFRPIGQLDLPHLDPVSTLVLYRNFHRGTALSLQLEDLAVPYSSVHSALAIQEVHDAISGWVNGKNNKPISFVEGRALIYHASPRYLQSGAKIKVEPRSGATEISELLTPQAFIDPWHRVLPKLPRLPYLIRTVAKYGFESLLNPNIKLLSIHQAKGRQAETVILDLEMARRTYEAYMQEPDDEHRVAYVAATRARERLLTLLPTEGLYYPL